VTELETRLSEALALHQQGRLVEAARIYQAVLREQPNHFDAMHLLGMATLQSGRTEPGVNLLRAAIALNGTIAAVHVTLGNGLRELKRPDDALESYDTAISLDPNHAQAWQNRGNALMDLKRPEAAVASYDNAIALRPDFAEAYSGRGNALWELRRPEHAIASFDRAIALRPDLAVAHHNRGNVLPYLNRLEEALASQDQAIALQPNLAAAHSGRGNALWELNRPEAALASYDRAITLKSGYADAYWNASLCLLQLGRYEPGWRLFEWRKRVNKPMGLRVFVQPLWLGEQEIAGKTLFIYWEQGLGDTIQFCRYAELAEARGARVILEVQGPLRGLLRQISPTIQIITAPEMPSAFYYHCPMMSLPLAFRTNLETIPAADRYLWATEDARARWSARLGPAVKRRIGLVWAGGTNYKGDHKRSMNLAVCLPLFDLDADWICLQKEIGENDVATLRGTERLTLYCDELDDFSDTAGLIELMDLVITVDTSVAHLAAAMGKPVWILLPYSSDWRWLRDRDDSPWYPTAKLFRQQRPGDWAGVVDKVARALDR
jgi:tetratricopeptide (TPR) repeat protein